MVSNLTLALKIKFSIPSAKSLHNSVVSLSIVTFNGIYLTVVFNDFSEVFHMEPKTHAGHMKAVKNLILDGTSKWLAKIFITGRTAKSHFLHIMSNIVLDTLNSVPVIHKKVEIWRSAGLLVCISTLILELLVCKI